MSAFEKSAQKKRWPLSRLRDPSFWRGLEACETTPLVQRGSTPQQSENFHDAGFALWPKCVEDAQVQEVLAEIDKVKAAGLPGIFALTSGKFEALFQAPALRQRLETLLGEGAVQLPGIWVHDIAATQRGWEAHVDEEGVLDLSSPNKITVWIKLSGGVHDAPMSMVHARSSRGVSEKFQSIKEVSFAQTLELLHDAHCVPAQVGDAIVWSPHLVHFGGHAQNRRVALSLEFARKSAASFSKVVPQRQLTLDEHLYLIGHNLCAYGRDERREPLAATFSEVGERLRDG